MDNFLRKETYAYNVTYIGCKFYTSSSSGDSITIDANKVETCTSKCHKKNRNYAALMV